MKNIRVSSFIIYGANVEANRSLTRTTSQLWIGRTLPSYTHSPTTQGTISGRGRCLVHFDYL